MTLARAVLQIIRQQQWIVAFCVRRAYQRINEYYSHSWIKQLDKASHLLLLWPNEGCSAFALLCLYDVNIAFRLIL